MTGDAPGDALVISGGRFLEIHAATAQRIDRPVDIVGSQGDMLDAFALVLVQILFDLTFVVLALIDGDADFPARRCESPREQTRLFSLDAEVTNFPEVE